jgi:hypothetical protein
MNRDQMFEELCADFGSIQGEELMCGDTVAALTVPPSVYAIMTKAGEWLKLLGCDYRDQIMEAIRLFVAAKLTNPILAGMILSSVETFFLQMCGA